LEPTLPYNGEIVKNGYNRRPLGKNAEPFLTLIENSPDAIIRFDRELRHLYANAIVYKQFGIPSDAFFGKTHREMGFPLDFVARWEETLRLVFATGKAQRLGFQFPTGIYVDWLCIPELDEVGQVQAVIASGRDISERKRAEKERDKIRGQKHHLKADGILGSIVEAAVFHFNNQLAMVIGNLEMAMVNAPWSDVPFNNLTEAMKAARRAAEVSDQVLAYIRKTAGKKEPMDICEVWHRSIPLLRSVLPGTILLWIDFPPTGPLINGNDEQIQQALVNLMTNAWEYCAGHGIIRLSVYTVSADSIPSSHRYPLEWYPRDATYACLEVRSPGCGISDQDIEKIFILSFTSDLSERELGLFMVLGILWAHRGVMTVESIPNWGRVFRAFLPVAVETVAH
jgi:PAS domain S-box-containing protein